MKWKYILNIDTLAVVILVLAVLYCFFTTKRKYKKIKDIDEIWDPEKNGTHVGNWWDIKERSRRKKRTKKNKHEERCREIFEKIFGRKFKSVRPEWLKNPVTGKNLELDGFCDKIRTPLGVGLAFEYDGVQHSKYNKHFHRSGPQEFLYQCKKDSWKDVKCKEKGIMLIRIPHFVIYEDLERYITDKLGKMNLLPQKDVFYSNPTRYSWSSEQSLGFLSGLYS